MATPSPSLWHRFLALTTSTGVLWFGLPCAIVFAGWQQFHAQGYAWRSLWSLAFVIRLVIAIYFFGYCGGRIFNWWLRNLGYDRGTGAGQ